MKISLVVILPVVAFVAGSPTRGEPSLTEHNLDWIKMAERKAGGKIM